MSEPHIIRASAGVIAIWKPAGLATQAPAGIPSAEAWLRRLLDEDSSLAARRRPSSPSAPASQATPYLGVPHRLDRAVSGVVLFAATPRAARKLSRQFERRQIGKAYRAIVAPGPGAESGEAVDAILRAAAEPGVTAAESPAGTVTWRDRLEKLPAEARARIVAVDEPGGREAVTIVRLLRRLPADRLLLELSPVTGRMHQLRLQAAARGMPIVGDDLYGSPDPSWNPSRNPSWTGPIRAGIAAAPDGDDQRTRPIALHAWRITYADPDTESAVTIEATLPDYWPESART